MVASPTSLPHHISADTWTKLGTASETFQALINNFLLLGPSIDNAMDWPSDGPLGVSLTGTGVATALSIAITIGTAYCSYLLSLKFQQQTDATIPMAEVPAPALTRLQRVGLGLNYLGNAAEAVGPANFLLSAVTSGHLSRWTEVGVNAGLTAAGFLGSWAKFRTAKQTMLDANARQALLANEAEPGMGV